MEPGSYDEMFEDSMVAQGSGARPHAQVHLLSPTDKCKVCNEPAAKHVHYGAMTCFSCRAFFRRSIQNKTAATYVCRRSRNCEINLRTRKNCQFCRYAKCISAGMKPSWVLSEDERQRRFRKNRERGGQEGQDQPPQPGQVVSSHKKERNSQSSSSVPELPLESIDEALLASMMEQQQNQQQTFVVKTEPRVQQVSPPILEQKREPEIVKTETKPGSFVSTAGQQYLVKTESGDGSFILAAPMASSQQSTILVYTALPQHPHPPQVHQSSGASAVIVPRTEAAPRTLISNIGVSGVTITPASSGSGAPVTTIKQSCFEKTKKPAASYQVPSSSVIVQSPQRQQQPQFAAASNRFGSSASVAPNFVLKQENQQQQIPLIFTPSSSNSGSSKPVEMFVVASSASTASRPQPVEPQTQVTLSQIVSHHQEQVPDWDSNYEDDIFTSDEEEPHEIIKHVLTNEPEVIFCEDERYQMEKLVKDHNDKYRSVNFGEELIKEMIMCSMFGIPVSTSAAISGYRLTVERITRIAHNLECFTDLPKNDQATLLMENADLLVNLRGAIFFDSKKKGVNQILISMGIEDMDTIKSIYTPLLKENSMKHIDYKTFNSIQTVANPTVETRYSSLQARVAELLSSDDVITVLTTYIILFSVDFCSLIDRRRVEQTQDVFIRMLQRYIYSQCARSIARVRLANTLEMVTCLREMADIKKMRKINVNVKVP